VLFCARWPLVYYLSPLFARELHHSDHCGHWKLDLAFICQNFWLSRTTFIWIFIYLIRKARSPTLNVWCIKYKYLPLLPHLVDSILLQIIPNVEYSVFFCRFYAGLLVIGRKSNMIHYRTLFEYSDSDGISFGSGK